MVSCWKVQLDIRDLGGHPDFHSGGLGLVLFLDGLERLQLVWLSVGALPLGFSGQARLG